MQFSVPDYVEKALSSLREAGYEACLVGGCVRDDLMGVRPHDYDVATDARPEEIRRVFLARELILDGEKHGTVTPVIDRHPVEITSFRADGDYLDGRHPESVRFTSSLEEDLARRDFTVNAMAFDPVRGLTDPFGGREDIEKGVIRCVGEPEARFREDALRILRAMRFASRLGFTIEAQTAGAMHDLRERLRLISRERIAAELTGVLTGRNAAQVLDEFHDVLFEVVPELFPLYHCPQKSVYHIYDVWEHTLHVVDQIAPRTPVNVWSALLHDCAKPQTRVRDRKGQDHYPAHQQTGARLAGVILRSLKMSNALTEDVQTLITYHDDELTPETVRLALSRVTPRLFDSLAALRRADLLAHAPQIALRAASLNAVLAERDRVLREGLCYDLKGLAVHGGELSALGYHGPELGRELDSLLNEVLRGRLPNDREALLKKARLDLPDTVR